MKELLSLYFIFFKIGIVNFGGGYAMLPLLSRELVDKRGWTTNAELADYYAIGQCTPGAIAVNVSTFIGFKRKGMFGGMVATLGFISPAFIIIFLVATLLTTFASNEYVANALQGIRVAVFALVLYAIVKLAKPALVDVWTIMLAIAVAIMAIFVNVVPLFVYVIFAGIYGFFISFIKEKKKYKAKEEFIIKKDQEEEKNDSKEESTTLDARLDNTTEPLVEETKETVALEVKPKKKLNINYKEILIFILGLFAGLTLGLFAIPITLVYKNKKFRNGIYATLIFWFILLISTLVMVFNGNNPIFFRLYGEFFRVGISAFGGGLATIPFLKELGASTGWFSQVDLANMIAVSESTPGAMGINMSTYVGYTVIQNEFGNYFLSFLGSMVSTLGLVSPSIIVIVIISLFINKFKDNKYYKWVFYGLRAASVGLIIAALYSIIEISLFNVYVVDGHSVSAIIYAFNNRATGDFLTQVSSFFNLLFNWKNLALGLCFVIGVFKFKKHPIIYIVIAAVLGLILRL
ncbi:MAG: chromate transporter [Acholeplasmatales bacterium]|nr:chromate transporter [Acholeplasmatales bacterium]